tara:strand:- start:1494 stop:2264 length:771 start_codon:yes stop_codon:yes gene_type:complete
MEMKRVFLACVLVLVGLLSVKAQVKNSNFQKLFDLYTMEEYDKCAYKAEKYSQKDKYKRDPEPYLYMAMCFYQAHVQPEKFDQEFDDPLKDALKYAYKFRKKDKTGELFESNRELLDKIREEALASAKFYYNDSDYRKASSEFKRIQKVIPDDFNVMLMTGVADIMAKNASQGERLVVVALDSIRAQDERGVWEKDEVTYDIMIKGIVGYTNYLSEVERLEEAQETLTFARKLVPDDATLKSQYKKIYAKGPEDEE